MRWVVLALLSAGCGVGVPLCGGAQAQDAAWGPFYHRFRLTLEPGERTEALGPFYYRQDVWEEWPEELGVLDLPGEPTPVQDAATTLALPPSVVVM